MRVAASPPPMAADGRGCGSLHRLYAAARAGDTQGMREAWGTLEADDRFDAADLYALGTAVEAGDSEAARDHASELLFADDEAPTLNGPVARAIGSVLYAFGYLASFVLFFGARSPEAVVGRLRWAYRTVGVRIRDTETLGGVERTTFRCPYRNLGADRWGERHACHDVLDLVDDGYVDWLARHRDIDYRRPRACAASECCYSEVGKL